MQYNEGAQCAEQIGAGFYETSAKNREGIRKVITAVAEHLLERQNGERKKETIQLDNITDLNHGNDSKIKKSCCFQFIHK